MQQSLLRIIQTEATSIRYKTLNYSNVCTKVSSFSFSVSPISFPPPQPFFIPLGLPTAASQTHHSGAHLKLWQEICFTRLVLTELPAVRHIATVWEMNDERSKSVISFVQTD